MAKANRFLNEEQVEQLKECNFYQRLIKIFGQFRISNEDNIFPEEVYWRLVRPKEKSDVVIRRRVVLELRRCKVMTRWKE